MEITCFNKEEVLYINKVGNIIRINIIENMKITNIISKSMYIIFYYSRSGIQFIQSRFKLIKFSNSKKR